MYDPKQKQHSGMKHTMNNFLCALNPTRALVIDAETLLSSSALLKHGLKPHNIVVLNGDSQTIQHAKAKGHYYSLAGISTHVLPYIDGTFDVIYFDYCGFPQKRSDGFDPEMDLHWAYSRLRKNGVVIVTFSRRFKDCFEKAKALAPNRLKVRKTVFYCETSSMLTMMLTKQDASVDPGNIVDSIEKAESTKKRSRSIFDQPILQTKRVKRKRDFYNP